MSYNIDHIEVLDGEPSIKAGDVVRLLDEHEDDLPESTFLEELESEARSALITEGPDRLLPIKDFWFSGEGSGHAYADVFLPVIAPCLVGNLDLVFFWEGGDSVSGLRIEEGKVTECDVSYVLTPKPSEGGQTP